jgi:hypothetical protein
MQRMDEKETPPNMDCSQNLREIRHTLSGLINCCNARLKASQSSVASAAVLYRVLVNRSHVGIA